MALAGAEHRRRVPVRRLDQHVGGGRGHLGGLAAHHATEADDPRVVGDDQVAVGARGELTGDAVEGGQLLPRAGAADADGALELVGVVAVDRPPHLEHHVVGDVDGERDRSHPGELDPARQPVRRGRRRVEAGDLAGDEDRAADRVLDLDRVAVVGRLGGLAVGRVVERHVEAECRLAGDAPERERVGPVGVDLELDDLVAQRQHVERVVAGLPRVGGQHDDAGVVLAEAELLGRADHARGDVAVGLARADREAAGQHGTREHDDHEVAGREVVRAADDALRLTRAVRVADVDGAPVDGLAVLLRLGLHGEHAADHQRALDVVAGPVDRLELEPERGQPRRERLGGEVLGQVDVLPDPGDGRLHLLRSPIRKRW